METNSICVKVIVFAEKQKTWDYYTHPDHIIKWNFADPSWHCPNASNELKVGGKYFARMEAKDGSFGFDFEAVYLKVKLEESFTYEFGGRTATVEFVENNGNTAVNVTFEPETENSIELQQAGWQAILNNFKVYVES